MNKSTAFHLRSHIFRRTQTGAAFVIVMSQFFKMGNTMFGNETERKSFHSVPKDFHLEQG